jgi:SagB-type dehydrogenase family enzyme
MLLEAGHIAQNVYLEATALGLGCCAVGAFQDEAVNQVLGVSGDTERALCLLTIGPLPG